MAWEDPRIDRQLLKLGEDDTLLVLTTGGCNVLDRLIDGPKHIVAADLNAAQNALLELKLACLCALTYEQFFQLFAHSNRRLFDGLYGPTLRPLLSEPAAAFWDANASFFDSVMYSGASGKLARLLVGFATLCGLGPMFRQFATCASLEEQREVYARFAWRVGLLSRLFDAVLPLLCPFAGVPASQMTLGGGAPRPVQPGGAATAQLSGPARASQRVRCAPSASASSRRRTSPRTTTSTTATCTARTRAPTARATCGPSTSSRSSAPRARDA